MHSDVQPAAATAATPSATAAASKPSSTPSDFDVAAATPQSALELCGQADSSALDKIKAIVAHHGIDWLNAAQSPTGWKAIHFAATRSPEILEWLLRDDGAISSANVMTCEQDRGVPAQSSILHIAVLSEQLETVKFIMSVSDKSLINFKYREDGQTARDHIDKIEPASAREAYQELFTQFLLAETSSDSDTSTSGSLSEDKSAASVGQTPSTIGQLRDCY